MNNEQLAAEALAVFDLMLTGCREQSFGDFQNGEGETIGPRMDALHAALRRAPERSETLEDDDARILVIQIDSLISIAERLTWGSDTEESALAQGAIDHARKVAGPFRYNGPRRPAPTVSSSAAPSDAKDNAVQQAQIWAQEARTQRAIVSSILAHFGLPNEDWHALELIKSATPSVQAVAAAGRENPTQKQLIAQLHADEKWTVAEQQQFAVFLARFPNESSQGIISLGSAWKHGKASAASPVELTDADIARIWKKWVGTRMPNYSFARAIERHLSGDTAAQGGE